MSRRWADRTGIYLSYLPGTQGPRARRPLDVRIRQALLRPETVCLGLALGLAGLLGVMTDWSAARVIGAFLGLH